MCAAQLHLSVKGLSVHELQGLVQAATGQVCLMCVYICVCCVCVCCSAAPECERTVSARAAGTGAGSHWAGVCFVLMCVRVRACEHCDFTHTQSEQSVHGKMRVTLHTHRSNAAVLVGRL